MSQKFEYDTDSNWSPLEPWHYAFIERVANGWRLVCIVKEKKESFVHYWEREV